MPRTLSPEEHQEIGRRYYKEQQYGKAVQAFTEAIETTARPTVTQYDHRAASYDKLQDLSSALKDGRNMIKADKEDIKGYLRTGSLLQKMDKPQKALDIYKYGMKNVPVSNKDFKILQHLHDSLTRKLSPARSFDPFTTLPVELAQWIMSYLSFREMVNCLRVSKGWKDFLIKSPQLWLNLDLSGARKDVSRIFVRNAVRNSNFELQSATFHRFRHADMVRNIATVCKNLTTLEITSGFMSETLIEATKHAQSLSKLVAHCTVTEDTVLQIMRKRPTMKHVEFYSIQGFDASTSPPGWDGLFPNLHTIVFQRSKANGPTADFADLFEKTPGLKRLSVKGWSIFIADLSKSALTEVAVEGAIMAPMLPKTLERLECELHLLGNLNANKPDFARLTHLTLNDGRFRIETFAETMANFLGYSRNSAGEPVKVEELPNISKLQHFALRNYTPMHEELFDDLEAILGNTSRILTASLGSLDLSEVPITDTTIERLLDGGKGSKLSSLHTVDFSRTNISGAGVKDLVDNLPALRTLSLHDCMRITSRDIIAYAEKKGVTIKMKMSDSVRRAGGRKVRYG